VPLALLGLRVVGQRQTSDGELEVTVIGTPMRGTCPRCGRVSGKQHDMCSRRKRDVGLGAYPVVLVLRKRGFRCSAASAPSRNPIRPAAGGGAPPPGCAGS
jgi:transposase